VADGGGHCKVCVVRVLIDAKLLHLDGHLAKVVVGLGPEIGQLEMIYGVGRKTETQKIKMILSMPAYMVLHCCQLSPHT
jgi:hypothetical protein